MKKFNYEITIEAEHEAEAESKLKGLCLLTNLAIIPKRQTNSGLTLTETEEKVIQYYRKGEKMIGIILHLVQSGTSIEAMLEMLDTKKLTKENNHEKV